MATIKMAIIGLGAFGSRILNPIPFFHKKDELEVVAICDVNDTLAKELAEKHEIPHWYTSYEEMLDTLVIDLVYVATPPSTHEVISKDVAARGIHIFCEKPLAESLESARNMLLDVKDKNIVHAVHFGQNYLPALNKFHKMVDDGYMGELNHIELNMHYSSWPPEWQQNDWISTRNGGFLLEQGVHLIQAIQRVFGRIIEIQSELEYPSSTESETKVKAKLTLESGHSIVIDGMVDPSIKEEVSLSAIGTEGVIAFSFSGVQAAKNGLPLEDVTLDEPFMYPWILAHIIKAVKGEPAEIYDYKAGYEAQVVVEIIRKGEQKVVNLRDYYIN
ncbi:putative dehydrogenase [Bacillus mesophilus]|uniref:Gfo/Idh/MocA family oxidoreductase n=1 Tax=Bacillus mesophilus TaxID=1808955 RepID=A0A6M0Q3U9_9BACI|nr:Gfo/Idh/MocA family oxidoreductase [Bacillus mesophilus]MBM7660336.1 putative dehydrogenase [Bacillus mesophilus]NEY71047.1 Gfo/Idh/MocA family oxidoreductase [Bacillus mesophilus]